MEKIVHIVPLGYESDRAIKPFEMGNGFKANKVFILSTIEINGTPLEVVQKHRKYAHDVKERLEKLNIEVELLNINTIDLLEVITKISYLILQEKNKNNIVYVNMSSAGRLTSVGATLAGMVHDAKVYYVESDDYSDTEEKWNTHGMTIVENVRLKYLENFKIVLPDKLQLKILVEIYKRKTMRNMDIINHLSSLEIQGFNLEYSNLTRNQKTAVLMKLNRRIIEALEKAEYIEKRRIGRDNIYQITESGKYVASISGYLENN